MIETRGNWHQMNSRYSHSPLSLFPFSSNNNSIQSNQTHSDFVPFLLLSSMNKFVAKVDEQTQFTLCLHSMWKFIFLLFCLFCFVRFAELLSNASVGYLHIIKVDYIYCGHKTPPPSSSNIVKHKFVRIFLCSELERCFIIYLLHYILPLKCLMKIFKARTPYKTYNQNIGKINNSHYGY